MFPLQWVVLVWVPLAVSQPAPPNCCATKTVGGVDYTFVREDSAAISYSCLSPCVYERDDQPGTSFCFAQGDQQVVCGDSTEGGSGDGDGPSWSEWGPWGPCSVTCGEGGIKTRERNCTLGLLPSIEEMLPSALEYVATIVAGLQNSTTDLLDMIEATLPQVPGMVEERMTEMMIYYEQYFASAKQALPWLFSSLAALLDSISGAGEVAYPGYGQFPDFSISIPDSLMEIPGQLMVDISLPGESVLGYFRSVLERQGDPSVDQGPTCPGEPQEVEICGMAACPA